MAQIGGPFGFVRKASSARFSSPHSECKLERHCPHSSYAAFELVGHAPYAHVRRTPSSSREVLGRNAEAASVDEAQNRHPAEAKTGEE